MSETFDEWVHSLHKHEDTELAAGTLEFLRELYDAAGPMRGDELEVALVARKMDLARQGIELLLADLRRTTDLREPNIELRVDDGVIIASYNGSYTAPPLYSLRAPEAICEIAENLRDHVVEALWTVWPLCPAHQVGLYAEPVAGRADWYCRTAQHSVDPIGQLRPSRGRTASVN